MYLLIHTPNYEGKLNVRSWAANRMDVLGEQRNTWPPGRQYQHFCEAQLTGEFLGLTPPPPHTSLSIHYPPWQRAWSKSPGPTYSSQQLDSSETVKWHFFPITLLWLKMQAKKPFCEMLRVMTTINLWLWLSAVLAKLWTVAYTNRVSLRNCFLAPLFYYFNTFYDFPSNWFTYFPYSGDNYCVCMLGFTFKTTINPPT